MSEDMTEDPFASEDPSEEPYDEVCECFYSKLAMHRLLSFLRVAQNQCTDSECFSTAPRLSGPRNTATSSDFYTLALIIGFLTLMYIFRPSSLRQSRHGDRKDWESGASGSSREPPPAVD